jgi:hypothetical protein
MMRSLPPPAPTATKPTRPHRPGQSGAGVSSPSCFTPGYLRRVGRRRPEAEGFGLSAVLIRRLCRLPNPSAEVAGIHHLNPTT